MVKVIIFSPSRHPVEISVVRILARFRDQILTFRGSVYSIFSQHPYCHCFGLSYHSDLFRLWKRPLSCFSYFHPSPLCTSVVTQQDPVKKMSLFCSESIVAEAFIIHSLHDFLDLPSLLSLTSQTSSY
jgi:hypothetical protein